MNERTLRPVIERLAVGGKKDLAPYKEGSVRSFSVKVRGSARLIGNDGGVPEIISFAGSYRGSQSDRQGRTVIDSQLKPPIQGIYLGFQGSSCLTSDDLDTVCNDLMAEIQEVAEEELMMSQQVSDV